MCNKVVDTCPFESNSIPDWYKTQKMCDKAVLRDFFILKFGSCRYKTQEMCDKAILENAGTLKSVPSCYKNKRYVQ